MNGAYAHVNGLKIYYELHGSGRPLVLLHGAGMNIGECWANLLPELVKLRRIVAIEFQGHGHTADIDRPITVGNLGADVVGVLDYLGIEEADIFGYSLGGLVSLEVAIRYPNRVGQVVAGSVAYRKEGYFQEIFQPGSNSPRLPTAADFAEMKAGYVAVAPFPGQWEQTGAKIAPLPTTVRWSKDELRSIRAPFLLVVGDFDIVRLEHVIEISDLIPDAGLAVLPDTTHMEVIRREELLVPLVSRFLKPITR
jgi:pimeloyl-ACP methyl ester carboxylesterase